MKNTISAIVATAIILACPVFSRAETTVVPHGSTGETQAGEIKSPDVSAAATKSEAAQDAGAAADAGDGFNEDDLGDLDAADPNAVERIED